MFGIGECEEVNSSMFWVQQREKRERQMKGCLTEQVHLCDGLVSGRTHWSCLKYT